MVQRQKLMRAFLMNNLAGALSLNIHPALRIELKIHSCLGDARCCRARCIINSADKPCHLAHLHSIIAHFNLPVSTHGARSKLKCAGTASPCADDETKAFFISLFIPRRCKNFKVGRTRKERAHAFRLYPRPCCCLCNYFSWCIHFSWALLRNGLLKHIIFHGVLGKCQMFAFMRGKKAGGLQKLATSNSANCVCSILFPLNEAAVQIFSTKFLLTLLRCDSICVVIGCVKPKRTVQICGGLLQSECSILLSTFRIFVFVPDTRKFTCVSRTLFSAHNSYSV